MRRATDGTVELSVAGVVWRVDDVRRTRGRWTKRPLGSETATHRRFVAADGTTRMLSLAGYERGVTASVLATQLARAEVVPSDATG